MTAHYYYLVSGLPELNISDNDPEYTVNSFREVVRELTTPEDFEFFSSLYYRFDISNLVHVIKRTGEPLDERGNYSEEALKAGLTNPETLPAFMEDFILSAGKDWEVTSFKTLQNELTGCFVDWSAKPGNDYLSAWFEFDNNLRNLLAGLNCRKFNLSAEQEVVGDYYEANAILKSKEKDFGLRTVIPLVDEVITHFDNPDIAVREFALEELRWQFADELDQDYYFTTENLMTYAIKLQLNQRNIETSVQNGEEQLESLLINIKQGYELPSEFE
ncbi:MAG: DUF2764 family protein [Bacteroidetes bacterium]|nr:DUF2764 family protein [Bacteroidota bacterium]